LRDRQRATESAGYLGFDQRVSRCACGRDSVAAIAYEETVAVTDQPNGRSLAAVL
jgi:hypothetical protein